MNSIVIGSGFGGIAAALTAEPASVLLTDHDPAATRLARLNARLSGVSSRVRSSALDWNTEHVWPPAYFDCAFAADIIYEPDACVQVAHVLTRSLRPGGRFLLADGQRRIHRPSLEHSLRDAFVPLWDEKVITVKDTLGEESDVVLRAWQKC